MTENYLPIGTICKINNIDKEIMIIGYVPIKNEKEIFDYSGCLYPEGVLSPEGIIAFNNNDIKEILIQGADTPQYKKFNEFLKTIDFSEVSENLTTKKEKVNNVISSIETLGI
jgi:hypothetical protein